MLLLGRDKKDSVLQVGSYKTSAFTNLDGTGASVSITFIYDTIIRLDSYDGDNWISRGEGAITAVTGEGMRLGQDKEITMLVYKGETIATIGGKLNVTPVAK